MAAANSLSVSAPFRCSAANASSPDEILDTLMRRRRRHDHAVDRVAWRWRAEPVSVMAPRVPTMMQARRVRVSPVSQEPGRIAPMAARQGRVRVAVPLVPRDFLPAGRGRVVIDIFNVHRSF